MSQLAAQASVWKKLLWLTLISGTLLFLDYTYHEKMAKEVLGNYAWLGFYRYGLVMDFRYSADVIVGAWLYVFIFIYGLLRRRLSNTALITFPILMVVLHNLTMR
jgi:hypothetical protein